MKNTLLLFIGILFCGQLLGQESKFELGVSSAVQFSNIWVNKFDGTERNFGKISSSFHFGVKGRYFFKEKISMTSGLFYQFRKYDLKIDHSNFVTESQIIDGSPDPIIRNRENDKLMLNEIAIPLNFEFWIGKNWNIFAGFIFQKSYKKKREIEYLRFNEPNEIKEVDSKIKEFPIAFSWGFRKKIQLKNTAFEIGNLWNFNFHQIEITSIEQSNFQYLGGLDFTFWFK